MWSVAGNNHSRPKVIVRDQIWASWSQHDMGFDLSENGSPETMYDEENLDIWWLAASLQWVSCCKYNFSRYCYK